MQLGKDPVVVVLILYLTYKIGLSVPLIIKSFPSYSNEYLVSFKNSINPTCAVSIEAVLNIVGGVYVPLAVTKEDIATLAGSINLFLLHLIPKKHSAVTST